MTPVESIDRTSPPLSPEGYLPSEINNDPEFDETGYFLDDLEYVRGRLESDSDRLFSDQVNVDICYRRPDSARSVTFFPVPM